MASDEIKKKWGTIFMGNREASVQQLQAMQEPLRREKRQKDQAADYMERVRAKAADRAREILGAAYAERQKVLEEARTDAARYRKDAETDCARLKAEGENARREAQAELEKARAERQEAERLRLAARDDGYQEGMRQSASELNEFRGELGQSLGSLLRAIERERHQILDAWRDDLVELVQCASQAGAAYVLQKEHKAVLKNMVFQALDQLENRAIVQLRVNPADEDAINDMFRAARERFPELKQWVINSDASIEQGGLIAESGTGSVDLRRENFREMVSGVLAHLGLPKGEIEEIADRAIREMVEREVAAIAALTPELDRPETSEATPGQEEVAEIEAGQPNSESETPKPDLAAPQEEMPAEAPEEAPDANMGVDEEFTTPQSETSSSPELPPILTENANPSYEDLEEELFPIDETESQAVAEPYVEELADPLANDKKDNGGQGDPLSEGGFI